MQSTGIVRRIDPLGRFVLPIEMRRVLDIDVGDELEIIRDGDTVILKKYAPTCLFCGSETDVQAFKGKNVCGKCIEEMKTK